MSYIHMYCSYYHAWDPPQCSLYIEYIHWSCTLPLANKGAVQVWISDILLQSYQTPLFEWCCVYMYVLQLYTSTAFTTPAPRTSMTTHCNYAIDEKPDLSKGWFVIHIYRKKTVHYTSYAYLTPFIYIHLTQDKCSISMRYLISTSKECELLYWKKFVIGVL